MASALVERHARPGPPGAIAGDPRPLRSAAYVRFFEAILRRQLQRSFHAVRLSREPGVPPTAASRPLVVYSNHPSWWDAALLPVLTARLYPERTCYGPIDADALERYRFMRRIGLFGVRLGGHAGAARFLRIGTALLGQADTLLCMTPEGRFADPRQRPIELRPGLGALLCRVPDVTVLPVALEYPFWTERTPEALARFGTPMVFSAAERAAPGHVEQRLQQALTEAMDALATDAASRDPARFERLLGGRAGVGGVYDAWRRARAWLQGRRFDAAHAPEPSSSCDTAARGQRP